MSYTMQQHNKHKCSKIPSLMCENKTYIKLFYDDTFNFKQEVVALIVDEHELYRVRC